MKRIEKRRDKIYRRTRARRVRTMHDAARFIDAVSFSLLFASTQDIELPSLFEAVKGRRDARIDEWDQDSDRVWVWKNDLPAARHAFYGKTLAGGKPVFVSLRVLPYLMAIGAPEDVDEAYRRGRITQDAKRVHDAVRAMGPTPTLALRSSVGLDRARYHRALDELQRLWVLAPIGAVNEQGAWPSQIFELASRWFAREAERARRIDLDDARRLIVRRYLATTVAADTRMIARIFGWPREQAHATIDELVARKWASKYGEWIMGNVG